MFTVRGLKVLKGGEVPPIVLVGCRVGGGVVTTVRPGIGGGKVKGPRKFLLKGSKL